jgi:transposase-like protein
MDPYNFSTRGARASDAPAIELPTRCPACRSPEISSGTATPDVNAYWRCAACGEVWNAARRGTATGRDRPWR